MGFDPMGPNAATIRLIAAALLPALLFSGCGGAEPTTPPPPPDNTRNVAVAAGDNQRAKTRRSVSVPPAIRVTNRSGSGVAGVSVTFAVDSGGGVVTGPSQTTGSDGVAAVGGWSLGAVGRNTLVATVVGATSGGPTKFTATADEDLIELSRDTTLSGAVTATRLVVRAGATITVTDSLNITTDSTIEVIGTIQGSCVPITLASGRDLVITGTIDNSCATLTGPAPKLVLIGRAGYEIRDATLRAPGDVEITNDPTLTSQDFEPQPAPAPASGQALIAAPICTVANANLVAKPPAARSGTNGIATGGRGADGGHWQSSCRGDIQVFGNVTFLGQEGGVGGTADNRPASGRASALAGNGGNGGRFTVQSTGDILLSGPMTLEGGQGGFGGIAIAIAGFDPAGPVAPNAVATGGDGGQPGLFALRARSNISFASQVDLVVGNAGDGGPARAFGAVGADAAGATTGAQQGGDALATGGAGGAAPAQTLTAKGLSILNPQHARVTGGHGGFGGVAEAQGGDGGKGIMARPNGADGGQVVANAGRGGDAPLLDHRGQLFGTGGAGGDARTSGANGGAGYEGCTSPSMIAAGGTGGRGGFVQVVAGSGGTGLSAGPAGGGSMTNAANGGKGGDGFPTAGAGGLAGNAGAISGNVVRTASRIPGRAGVRCLDVGPTNILIEYQRPVGTCLFNQNPSGSFFVRSVVPAVTGFTGRIINTLGASGILLQTDAGSFAGRGPVATRLLTPNGSMQVWYFFDPCVARDGGGDFTAEIQVEVMIGTVTGTITIPITGKII